MNASASNIEQLEVKLGNKSYSILIGNNLIKTAGSLIAPKLKGRQIIVVTDVNVAQLWLPTFLKSFEGLDLVVRMLLFPQPKRLNPLITSKGY